ncbi:hypothetical protein EB810_00655 [Altererythrobacter sp. FM1]|uniref:Tol-pal system protein YbgF n=1 Tax=Tsuneonella flava TaxID=2055955 RepID=A0ABX7KC97_9SPHN|nr:tetratricopeptide repeat protein [Tsuneonella flava]QSB44786.1 hypothetical protein IDJ81_00985 [Tsuneonella flava]ROT96510.1 hypothetical protein EB810_00655 [Altererythrobacter sp. FM1]
MGNFTIRAIAAPLALAAIAATATPVAAQDANSEARLKKVEAEIRALQRKVFPGADGKFFEPQITQAQPTTAPNTSAPTTTAVTDILARLDALESRIAGLTAQTEVNTNAINLINQRLDTFSGAAPAATTTTSSEAVGSNLSAMTGGASAPKPAAQSAQPAAKPSGPTAERLAAVQAITKPKTDDAGDDEYSYGFRLWDAKFYPEAEQQLSMFVEKYPKHSRISYGRNLLGRAYLDDGKPKEAAAWFLKNYQSDKQGARAPDSLLYLAEAMIALKDTKRACIALAEFSDTYPAVATGRLSGQYQANLKKVKCN